MATNQIMHPCRHCKRLTRHLEPATSHVLHLLLTVFTFGLWSIVWVFSAIANSSQKTCSACGKVSGLFG